MKRETSLVDIQNLNDAPDLLELSHEIHEN